VNKADNNMTPGHRENDQEARIQAMEQALLRRASARAAGSRNERRLTQLARQLAANETLRVQALRFVDVLPMLQNDRALASHLHSHFADISEPLPAALRWAIRHAETEPLPQLLAPAVRSAVKWIGMRFIAGKTVGEVLDAITRLHRQGKDFSLDLLGEEVLSDAEADAFQHCYLKLIGELADAVKAIDAPLHLSLKISSLDSQINPLAPKASATRIRSRLRPILRAVIAHGGGLTLDMEHYDTKAITLDALRGILDEDEFRGFGGCGIAMQAYLKDCENDLKQLIEWAGERGTALHVRLVRGAYWDREVAVARQHGWDVPVWENKSDCDHCYARCLKLLIEHHANIRPVIATHNVRSLALGVCRT
jgi:RHH-type proline utilization regulon transcriptional repressor/proline dehydrogenase/delta 1-pyrroline-5-carboxylate dehydrogenase